VALAVAQAWAGLALAYETDWPTSFWITALSGGSYLIAAAPWPQAARAEGAASSMQVT
jgi:hypothetical protein